MKPKLISIFCMLLIVLIPVSTSAQFRDLNEPLRLAEKVQQERITEEQAQLEEDLIGEDIVVEVDSYQPRILKSNLLEESDVKVYALLKGITSNPTVEISNIRNVAVRVLNITTDPENKPVTIGGITYIKPQVITFDNLGYLQIPIRKIPRQDDVPDNIDLAINARLYFDVSEGLTASRFDDFLLPQRHDEWLKEAENHRFFAGYIRASEILTDQAAFIIYDSNKREVDKLTLKDGQTSGVISNRIYGPYGGIFDKYRIKLNSVRGLTKIAQVYILKDNELIKRTLSEGQELYPGSKWVVKSIDRYQSENKVVLERQDGVFSILKQKISKSFEDSSYWIATGMINTRPDGKTELSLRPEPLETSGLTQAESDKINKFDKEIKEAASNENILDSIKEEIKKELDDKEIKENYRNALVTQLKKILNHYLQRGIELTSSTELANQEELSKIKIKIEEINLLIGKPSPAGYLEKIEIPQTSEQAYSVSLREFEKLLNEYPDVNDEQGIPYAVTALKNIAEINLKYLKNHHQKASEAYKRLIEEYPEYVKEKITDYQLLISFLDEVVKRDADSIQIYESDDQKPIIVTLFDITQPEIEPTTTLSVDNKILQDLREGEVIQDLANDIVLWKVLEIKPESILIDARETKTDVPSSKRPQVIELQKNKQIPIPMYIDDYQKQTNPDKIVRLISTKIQRAASITILPEPERAFSDSNFNLHITIDKAAISPPIFTDSLGDEISRTQNLLNKLNNIIAKVEKIQNFWTKFCFVTFGALWAKNLLFGGKATLARQKLTPRWKEKYTDALSQGYKKSYDAFIQEHKEEYNKEFELSNQLITDIKTNQYQSRLPDHIKNLGPDYDELKKDYYYSTQFARANPQNKVMMREAIELDASLVRTALDNEIAQFQNKNYNELPNEVKEKIKNIIESTVKYRTILESSKDKDKGIEDIYNTPTDRREIIDIYRTLESKKRYEDYFKNKKYQSIGATDEHEDIASSLKETYLPSTTSTVAKISSSRVIIKKVDNGNKAFWLDPFGNEHEITLKDDISLEEQIKIGSNVDIKDIGPAQLTAGDSKQQFSHIPRATYYDSGKDKGRVNRISIDDLRYAEVEYSTTGRISNIEVYERADPNSELGLSTDIRAGDLNSVLASAKDSNDLELQNKIKNMNSCISRLNTKLIQNSRGNKFQTYGLNCPSDSYSVSPTTEPFNKQSCTDFMSPGDCKLLFNACDPVICPPSRCNFGGRVQTDNVVQSGLVGSILYCLPNYKEGVIMPICLTGLLAGLQNIRSILEGYTQCLKRAKVSGEYVGICDRLRSFYLCDMITKEAVAILNIKGGLLSILSEKFFDKGSGGGEYASFKQNVENSVDTLKFFTQDYAKNVFAQYSGKGLPELGTEICKNVIFGKGIDLGNLFNQAARPESPPQFTAFFDETPLTDITEPPLSHYSIFYHIYAGESEEIGYSVYLRGILGDVLTKRPIFIARSKRIPAGGFASENIDKQLPSGFNQICVELKSRIYGIQTKCGFGKATTSFAIEELNNLFVSNQITQKIDSEEECVPEQSRITTISSQDSSLLNGISLKTPISAFSPGLTQTGILRKCSSFSPGVGSNTDSWIEIGTCGKDKLGRDLGICWLYKPSVNLITDSEIREVAEKGLEKTRSELSETLDIKNLVSDPEASGLIARAQTLVQTGKIERDTNKIDLAVDAYREVVLYSVSRSLAAKAQFELANAYMVRAEIMVLKPEIPREETEVVKGGLNLNEKEKDRTAPEIELVGIAKDLTATEVKKSDKESQKIQIRLKDENKLIRAVIYINDESLEGTEFKNDDGNLDKIYDLDLSEYMDKILPKKVNLLTILAVDEFGNENKYSIGLILKE